MDKYADHFYKLVKEQHQNLNASLDKLVEIIASDSQAHKTTVINETLGFAKALDKFFSENNSPEWISVLINMLEGYPKPHNGATVNKYLINHYPIVKAFEWDFESDDLLGINFDSVFENYRKESKLDELLDEIISILQKMHDSNEIDSGALNQELLNVIGTVKKSKAGSFASFSYGWQFLIEFVRNYLWSEAKRLPALGSLMEALEKTIQNTDKEIVIVTERLAKQNDNFSNEQKQRLEQYTNRQALTYDTDGKERPLGNLKSVDIKV